MTDYISQLPEEVLGKIFREAYPYIDCNRQPDGAHLGTLSRVSREWYYIVRTHRKLWSTVNLHLLPYHRPDFPASRLDLAGLAIRRSGEGPLAIKCTATDHENTRKYERSFDIVFSAAERWEEVHLDGLLLPRMVADNPGRWNNSKRSMPLLRKLSLSRANHCDALLGTFMGLTIGSLPNLTHLYLERYTGVGSFAGNVTSRGFPWSQLTHLELEGGLKNGFAELGSIDDFFRQVPGLISLRMEPLAYYPRRNKSPPVLEYLEEFAFSVEFGNGNTRETWPLTLSFLNAPNLTTLSIDAGGEKDSALVRECLPLFLKTSSCPVRNLTLINGLDESTVLFILQHLPSVERLFINSRTSDCSLHLLVWTGTTRVLPNLTTLSLVYDGGVTKETLSAVLASRSSSVGSATPAALEVMDLSWGWTRFSREEEFVELKALWWRYSLKGDLWPTHRIYIDGTDRLVTNWFPTEIAKGSGPGAVNAVDSHDFGGYGRCDGRLSLVSGVVT